MNMSLTIQEKLKDLRSAHGLPFEQLSEQIGLSKSMLDKYMNDDCKDISPFAIVILAKFYYVITSYLLRVLEQKTLKHRKEQHKMICIFGCWNLHKYKRTSISAMLFLTI